MLILLFFAVGLLILGILTLGEAGLFKGKRIQTVDAKVVDESEDEVYDNIGGTKTRFFKVYEYFDGEENRVLKSERPKRRIDGDVGRKCVVFVDTKSRRAMEKRDRNFYSIKAFMLILAAVLIVIGCVYIKLNVPEAVLF